MAAFSRISAWRSSSGVPWMRELSNPSERKTRYLRPSTTAIWRARPERERVKVSTWFRRAARSAPSTERATASNGVSVAPSVISESGSRASGTRVPPAVLLAPRSLLHDEAQGVEGAQGQAGQAQAVEGALELPPVGGEAEHELRPARGAVGGHGHEVGGVELPEEARGRLPGPGHGRGLGECQIEEKQEVAPGGGGHAGDLPWPRDPGDPGNP